MDHTDPTDGDPTADARKQYDRDFLLQLQYSKDSTKKPVTLPNIPEIIPDEPVTKPDMVMRSGPGNYRDLPDFTPGFLRPSRGMSVRSDNSSYRDLPDFTPGFLRLSRERTMKASLSRTSDSVGFREFDPGFYTPQSIEALTTTMTEETKAEEVVNPEEKKAPVLKYKYKQDQWSPLNPEGKMQYDRDFLLQLRYSKHAMKKPDTLPNFPEIIPDKPLLMPSLDKRSDSGNYRRLTPGFVRPLKGEQQEQKVQSVSVRYTGTQAGNIDKGEKQPDLDINQQEPKIQIAGPPLPRCYLDSEKVFNVLSRLKNPQGGNVEILLVNPVLKSSVEEMENQKDISDKEMVADQNKSTCVVKDELQNETSETTSKPLTLSTGERELFRKVRSILNKLTPQKFQTLIKQVQDLVIDIETRLKGVTALIWKQATTDTAYAREYASLCTHLQQVEVPLNLKKGKYLRFRIVLLILCRKSFTEILNYAKSEEKVSTTGNLQKTIKHRRKYVGIVRFIGELFQHGLLLEKIILDCLSKLLQSENDILLECFCQLLLVIGETLDERDRLDDYIHQIQEILKKKKVSARCCFMLQDVIETRDNEWKPLRQQNTPTTFDEVHKQADLDNTLQTLWDDSYPPVPTIIIDPPPTRIPASRHPRPLPDPATVASDLTRLKNERCRIYETPSAWSRGTPFLESGEPEEDLYRKVRSILNKLTPQKFQTLIKQVQGLVIDTETRLTGVTDIIFEKAINEPAFSVTYAIMCRYLLTLKVLSDTNPGESVNVRVILLTKCQREFERAKDIQLDLDRREMEMREAKDQKKVTEMKVEFETAVTNAGRRSQGNIRFMGELFKLKMLTETIMHDCIFKLLKSRQELCLEDMCRLFMTIGKELESEKAKPRMDQYFKQMRRHIADKKLSYRCRFMLFGVIILRKNNWKPRREEVRPKTIDQIHKDAEREAVEQNRLMALHMAQQSRSQAGGSMEEGWNSVSSKAIRNIDRNIDVSKLRIEKNANENIQLGPARSFGGWARGNSGGGSRASQENEKPEAPGKRFSALSKEDDQRSRAFGRVVSPARGEGRMRGNQPGGGFNREKVIPRSSQEQERETALASARSLVSGCTTLPSDTTSREGSRNRGGAMHEMERPLAPVRELSEDEMEKKTLSIVDEYLHIQDREEAIQCVRELNSPKTTHCFVYFAINHVLERSKQARQQTGHLLHDLIKQKVISVDTYLQGVTEILQAAEDMEIDIPKIWLYLGELIGPMIQDGSVPLSFLTKACEPLKASGKAGNLMAEVLHDASQRLGHKIVAHLWRNNMMDWTDFVSQEKLQQFLKDKNLEFTVGPDSASSTPTSKVSMEWIIQNLSTLLNDPKCDNEKTFDWIGANIPDEITKENKFIRALISSVCSSAISGSGKAARVDPEVVKKWRALLIKYLDHSAVFELQALYALQALVNSLEHPSGVLRSFFDTLYDEEIISEDAFNQWETSKEEPEGKGVALKQVLQFFAWLREGEEEEEDALKTDTLANKNVFVTNQ